MTAALRQRRATTHGGTARESQPRRRVTTIAAESVDIPDSTKLVHLQLRPFAGCPVCNLHLQSVVRRHDDISAVGIVKVVVFHSQRDELTKHAGDLPFHVVADPDKHLYAEFGAEASPRALLHPKAWPPIIRAVLRSAVLLVRGKDRPPELIPHGVRFELPADFLITPDGTVRA